MIFKSQHPDLDIPNVDLWTFLFEREDLPWPADKEIYIDADTGRSYSWASTRSTALEFGRGLRSQWGFKRGDCLGFFSPNSIDYPCAMFGALWAGGCCSTANPAYTVEELAFQMKDSGIKGIVTQVALLPVVREAARAIGLPDDRIILIGDGRDTGGKFKHFTEIRATAAAAGGHDAVRTGVDPKRDLSFLVYSSGTTGLPKGVMLTHYNIVANLAQLEHIEILNGIYHSGGPDGKGDKSIGTLPFFHIYGLTCIAAHAVRLGLPVVVMAKFDLDRFCGAIEAHGVSFASVAPPIVLALAKHPAVARYDLSSLKWLNSGAAPLGRDLVDQVWARLAVPVMQGYGLSETAPTLAKGALADWKRHNGAVGKLLPNIRARIVDPADGADRPAGEEGELWVSGPNVFPGYLNRPDLQPETFSDDGYFKTGDIGYIDAKGNLFITDRLKELIKYSKSSLNPSTLSLAPSRHDRILKI
ncbi:hypothetical protein F4778DRAFT_735882 [Xylariomycetidae sp. FL2044]|nr:hypothetical protein F4778DRAFT_735882 [Xylariomycetidae sp. FL2044]